MSQTLTVPPADQAISPEKAGFDLLGYAAPWPLADPSTAAAVRDAFNGEERYLKNPHTDSPAVRAMLRDPALQARVAELCGSGLTLWRSAVFRKAEGAGEIGWHHDKHFHDGDGDIRLDDTGSHFSVLFGLTDIVQTTGMIELVPGSQTDLPGVPRDTRPYHRRPASEHILRDLPTPLQSRVRPVLIPAGSFLIFHSAMLHRSLPHAGGVTRLGLAIRLVRNDRSIPPELAEPKDIMPFPPEH